MSNRSISINLAPLGSLSMMLGVLFIGLKLAHVITWSWLWVLAPFWMGFAFFVCCAILFLVVGGLIAWLASR